MPPEYPLAPIVASEFKNTAPDVAYVGAKACAECHESEHSTYLHTTHSRAFREADPAAEPPDAEFQHAASGRSYQVYRRDGKLYHRETLLPAGAVDEPLVVEHPVRYSLGSNTYGRSYLIEVDGFLAQSPISWYEKAKTWDISPGYDVPFHQSFTRSVGVKCLACHVGRVEATEHSSSRVKIHEAAIGCEACHGPGSLHVERRQQASLPAGEPDLTIVNPARLSRDRQEAICAQCHLSGVSWVALRGRDPLEYRPSLRLEDFRAYYVHDSPSTELTAAGHIEQMHQSACYKGSQSLTCTTCHDPHQDERHYTAGEAGLGAFYRSKCLTCHGEQSCGLPIKDERRRERQDHCATCHMPRSKFSIPHAATTNHCIGVHATPTDGEPTGAAKKPSVAPPLRPFYELDHLSPIDRDRNLGLAYYYGQFLSKHPAPDYGERALVLLRGVRERGLHDPEVDGALADLLLSSDPSAAAESARSALDSEKLSAEGYVGALAALSQAHLRAEEYDLAEKSLERLVRVERRASFWLQLGICRGKLGKTEAAIAAVSEAVKIDPAHVDARSLLAALYEQAGQSDRAEAQRRFEMRLREWIKSREPFLK